MSDPSTVVTTAAYLLFYRRRSSTPLGGPRFTEIFEKFDSNDDADDDSSTEVGDDRRSEDNFGRRTGQNSRDGLTTNVRPLMGPDDDDLPSYGSSVLHPSVEDEGVEMSGPYQSLDSNPIRQAWSFGESKNNADISDCGSDTVQVSSEDERGAFDQDVEMHSTIGDASDSENRPSQGELISVPTKTGSDRDSEEVAEIHVEGDKDTRP